MIKNLFFFNEIDQVNIRNKILQKKIFLFQILLTSFIDCDPFFQDQLTLVLFLFYKGSLKYVDLKKRVTI